MSEPTYKWSHPSEWLDHAIEEAAGARDVLKLAGFLHSIATVLDGDQIQDLFQGDMDADGYFATLCRECNAPRDESELAYDAEVDGLVCATCREMLQEQIGQDAER